MVIEQSLQSLQQGQSLMEPTLLLESFEAILRSGHADLSLSQLLTLPSEGYLSFSSNPSHRISFGRLWVARCIEHPT